MRWNQYRQHNSFRADNIDCIYVLCFAQYLKLKTFFHSLSFAMFEINFRDHKCFIKWKHIALQLFCASTSCMLLMLWRSHCVICNGSRPRPAHIFVGRSGAAQTKITGNDQISSKIVSERLLLLLLLLLFFCFTRRCIWCTFIVWFPGCLVLNSWKVVSFLFAFICSPYAHTIYVTCSGENFLGRLAVWPMSLADQTITTKRRAYCA